MIYSKDLLHKLHRLSFANQPLVEKATVCGCFYCGAIYSPDIIDPEEDYCIDFPHDTALCHYCGIDSVIPDNMGVEITPELLEEMYQEFFGNHEDDSSASEAEQEEPDDRLQRVLFPCNGAPSEDKGDICVVVFKDRSRTALKEARMAGALGLDDMSEVSIVHALPSGTAVVMYVTLPDNVSRVVKWDYQDNVITVWDM